MGAKSSYFRLFLCQAQALIMGHSHKVKWSMQLGKKGGYFPLGMGQLWQIKPCRDINKTRSVFPDYSEVTTAVVLVELVKLLPLH